MDTDKLSKIAKQAEEIVLKSGVSEAFKVPLFEKTFSLLAGNDSKVTSSSISQVSLTSESLEGKSEIDKLIQISGIEKDQLQDIYDFTDNGPKVITTVMLGENTAKRQQSVALLHLLASYICYDKDREDAEMLRLECEELGIVDPGRNFSKNLSAIPHLIIVRGKKKSAKKQYKITIVGRQEALRLLNQLTNNNNGSAN